MASLDDVQSFVERLEEVGLTSEEIEPGLWVLSVDGGRGQIVVNFAPPVVVFRVNVMDLPADSAKRTALMQKLLELNATDLVHGSYGIEDSSIVLKPFETI